MILYHFRKVNALKNYGPGNIFVLADHPGQAVDLACDAFREMIAESYIDSVELDEKVGELREELNNTPFRETYSVPKAICIMGSE